MEQKFKKAFTTSSKVAIEAVCEMLEKLQEPFLVVNETPNTHTMSYNLYVKEAFLDSGTFEKIKVSRTSGHQLFGRAA